MAGIDILFFILLEASFENKCEIMVKHFVPNFWEL
jgi:hypothetical protein